MSRQSIQKIKAMLLCIVYAMFADSVDIHRENYWGDSLRKLWYKVMGRNVLEILMPSVDSVNIYSI